MGQERLLLIRFGSGRSRTTDVGRSRDRGGQAPALRDQDEKNAGDKPPRYGNRENYSRCLTSPNVVNERFVGETGPGK